MGESAFRLALGESWDVVEVVRSLSQAVGLLTTEVDALQKIVAGQEARLQVLEGKQVVQVGTLVSDAGGAQGGGEASSASQGAASVPVRGGRK